MRQVFTDLRNKLDREDLVGAKKNAYQGVFGNMLSWAMVTIGRDVEQGSYSALWAATAPDVEEKNYQGFYFVDPVSQPCL